MKKIQAKPEFKTTGNGANAKITRIQPNMQKCGTFALDGMGTLASDTCDPQFHSHTFVSLEGLTPAEAADAIEKINAQGKRSTDLSYWDIVIETVGQRRLAALLSEFMGY